MGPPQGRYGSAIRRLRYTVKTAIRRLRYTVNRLSDFTRDFYCPYYGFFTFFAPKRRKKKLLNFMSIFLRQNGAKMACQIHINYDP